MDIIGNISSLCFLLTVILLVSWVDAAEQNSTLNPLLEISQGKVQGKVMTSRDGREYLAFLNIPYGTSKRFQNPTPAGNWTGIRNGTVMGNICAQIVFMSLDYAGEEDCLRLNVYTPNAAGKKPVMVYFHGGGFTIGTANYFHANYFMDEDVVLVMVNYRLGAFGFLSTQDDVISGNFGLKDQSLALRWVQKNIDKFGGDPNSVTLFGGSAGGASVNYHMLSPLSSGLFKAGISQSGSSLLQWAHSTKPKEASRRFGEGVGCPSQTSQELSDCLQTKSTSEILAGVRHLAEWGFEPFAPLGPSLETDSNNPGSFLTKEPQILLENGNFNQVPWMIMLNKDEGILLHSAVYLATPKLKNDLTKNWKRILPIALHYNHLYTNWTEAEQAAVTEKVYKFYFGNKSIGEETREELTQLFSDRVFNYGVKKASLLAAKHIPVYPVIYAYRRPDWNTLKFIGIDGDYGVSHGDECSLQFSSAYDVAPEIPKGSKTEQVSKNMVKLWTSFARDGKPSLQWTSTKSYTDDWRPISQAEVEGSKPLQYYKIDTETSIVQEPFTDRLEFWREILHDSDFVTGGTVESHS